MTNQQPLVSVIVPTADRCEMLRSCLESVFASAYDSLEVIVVDDASSDDTRAVVQSFSAKNIRYIRNEKRERLVHTRRRGAESAQGPFYLFLDDDNIIAPDMIEKLVLMCSDESIGVVGPLMLYFSDKKRIWWYKTVIAPWSARTIFPYRNALAEEAPTVSQDTDGIPNVFMTTAAAYHRVNGFDEEYLNTWTEADFCKRVEKRGLRIVSVPSAVTYHQVDPRDWNGRLTARSMGDNQAKAYTTIRNRYKYVARFFGLHQKAFFFLIFSWAYLGLYVVTAVRFKKWKFLPEYLRGSAHGWMLLFTEKPL